MPLMRLTGSGLAVALVALCVAGAVSSWTTRPAPTLTRKTGVSRVPDYVYRVSFVHGGAGYVMRHRVSCGEFRDFGGGSPPPYPTLYGIRLADGSGVAVKAPRLPWCSIGPQVLAARPFSPVILFFPRVADLSTAVMYPDPVHQPSPGGTLRDVRGWIEQVEGDVDALDAEPGFLVGEVTREGLRRGSPVPGQCFFMGRWEGGMNPSLRAGAWDNAVVRYNGDYDDQGYTLGRAWNDQGGIVSLHGHRVSDDSPDRHGRPGIVGFRFEPGTGGGGLRLDAGRAGTAWCPVEGRHPTTDEFEQAIRGDRIDLLGIPNAEAGVLQVMGVHTGDFRLGF